MTSPRRRGEVSRVRRSFKSSTAYLSSRELRDGRRPDGEDTLEHRPARSTGAHARSTRSLMSVFSSSAKRHVAPVMLAMKAGVGRVSLDHRASTEGDATLFGLCGHPGGRESVDDGDGAPRSTRRADNRILALSTWLARNHRVTSASKILGLCSGRPGNGGPEQPGRAWEGIQQGLGHVENTENESSNVLKRQIALPKTVSCL